MRRRILRRAGVTATSADKAWAVGTYSHGGTSKTLIAGWDGANWTKVPSPSPGGGAGESALTGVDAGGPCSAWPVGYYDTATVPRPDAGASLGLRPRADPANNVPRPIDANIAVVAAGGSAA
jgi:hypothetical protein